MKNQFSLSTMKRVLAVIGILRYYIALYLLRRFTF